MTEARLGAPSPLLLPAAELRGGRGLPGWVLQGHAALTAAFARPDPPYPCYFGVEGESAGSNFYTYVEAGSEDASVERLAATLEAFLASSRRSTERRSLLAFFGPPEPGLALADYRARFWDVLSELTALDRHPWPRNVPRDPEDPDWNVCFAGERLFVFGCCPAYRRRRSRNLGPCLVVVLQSRRIFHGIEGTTRAGRAAKERIRLRLLGYDDVPPYSELGPADRPSFSKWRQYFPNDDDEPVAGPCPFVPPDSAEPG
jgi:uncharacterized protein